MSSLSCSTDFVARTISRVRERIVDAFVAPFGLSGLDLVVSVSVGLAAHPGDDAPGSLLVRRADEAMYRAKSQGKNRFHISR